MVEGRLSCKLRDVIKIKHGFAFPSKFFSTDGPHILLTPGNFREEGGFRWLGEKQKFFAGPVPEDYVLSPGQMLVVMTEQAPGLLGSTFLVPTGHRFLHNQRLGLVQIEKPNRVCAQYLHFIFASPKVRKTISAGSAGTKVKHTSPDKILDLDVDLPPLPEQRKIAEILQTWDEAIEALETETTLKETVHSGYVKRLIHDPQYQRQRLRPHLEHMPNRNAEQKIEKVLSVTNSAGFVLAEDQFTHRIASADLSNYKIVQRGQYAYNPARINVGSIARLDRWTAGVLSPMYVVFQVKPSIDSDFFYHWLFSAEARQRIRLAAQGSVRKTVNFDDLGSIPLPVPSLDRQRAVAQFLNESQRETERLRKLTQKYQQQKRGLMQKLLTGKWRVKD